MRTERRMDMTKQIVAFRNFANAPKNYILNTNQRMEMYEGFFFFTYVNQNIVNTTFHK
jgi:hypothetical protein